MLNLSMFCLKKHVTLHMNVTDGPVLINNGNTKDMFADWGDCVKYRSSLQELLDVNDTTPEFDDYPPPVKRKDTFRIDKITF